MIMNEPRSLKMHRNLTAHVSVSVLMIVRIKVHNTAHIIIKMIFPLTRQTFQANSVVRRKRL